MFCILLANLRKQAKTPYNLRIVNEHFTDKADAKRALLDKLKVIIHDYISCKALNQGGLLTQEYIIYCHIKDILKK